MFSTSHKKVSKSIFFLSGVKQFFTKRGYRVRNNLSQRSDLLSHLTNGVQVTLLWKLSIFEELTTKELYTILRLRQRVFVVEQQCIYLDCDDKDKSAHHVTAWDDKDDKSRLAAYLRILPPKKNHSSYVTIGRVLTHPDVRGQGLGKELMSRSLEIIETIHPQSAVCISAQQYLIDFYQRFGFQVSSDVYKEDGIPHIKMILNSPKW